MVLLQRKLVGTQSGHHCILHLAGLLIDAHTPDKIQKYPFYVYIGCTVLLEQQNESVLST